MAEEIESQESPYESAKKLLTSYLNKRMRIAISDGRVIDGNFLCTDRDCNIVLSNCEEFLSKEEVDECEHKSPSSGSNRFSARQPRTLSLAIVPGEHILSISLAEIKPSEEHTHSSSGETSSGSSGVLEVENHNQTASTCT